MPTSHAKKPVAPVKEISIPITKAMPVVQTGGSVESRFEALLTRLGGKIRVNIEKHLALCDAEPNLNHGRLWRRLAGKLGELAPMPVQVSGPQAIQFFVADGKYREQVFSLEDLRDGNLSVYLTDILADAVAAKMVKKNGTGYIAPGANRDAMTIESIDSNSNRDPAPHMKHMIGWNRKAIKITLSVNDANDAVASATESLCELAAKRWQLAAKA